MKVFERGKSVEIWVPKGTPEADLTSLIQEFIVRGCRPVIYRSGSADLSSVTAALLAQNV